MTRLWLKFFLLAQLVTAFCVNAAEPQLREGFPDRYEVVEGDTLWDISEEFLEDAWRWPEVWQVNPQIANPDLIYPGDLIVLSFEDGAPVLSLQRGSAVASRFAAGDLPEIKLTPQVRRERMLSPVQAIPMGNISSLLSGNRIVTSEELEVAPYFLVTERDTLLGTEGDIIFARGQWTDGISSYEIVRAGKSFIDPETEEEIGLEAEMVGEATLLTVDGDRASLRVDDAILEVRMGDRLLPRASAVIDSTYFPQPPEFAVEGKIIEIGKGLAYGGGRDTLIINLGIRDNIEVGHLLTVQKPDHDVRDTIAGDRVTFPGEKFASVLVFRVFDKTSMGLVLSSDGPIRTTDRVVTP